MEELISVLAKRRMEASYAANREDAARVVLEMIPDNATVGIGGSISVQELNILAALKQKGCTVYWHWLANGPEEINKTRRLAMTADVYLSGTNALTEDGILINVDGFGNRVASMVFGPKKVIVIAGQNKITKDIHEGLQRIKKHACTANARRLNRKTPCASRECTDCNSPERMCNITTLIEGRPNGVQMHVLLVGEPMGF